MKLIAGAGSIETGACWMSAVNYYATNGASWTDQPDCVCPVIRELCIRLNDRLPSDEERERVIGPHLFAPVGTYDKALLVPRARVCASFARQEADAADAAAEAAAYYANAADSAAAAAAEAYYAAKAADAAAYAKAAYAANAPRRILALILELCAMGERKEVCSPVGLTQEQSLKQLTATITANGGIA